MPAVGLYRTGTKPIVGHRPHPPPSSTQIVLYQIHLFIMSSWQWKMSACVFLPPFSHGSSLSFLYSIPIIRKVMSIIVDALLNLSTAFPIPLLPLSLSIIPVYVSGGNRGLLMMFSPLLIMLLFPSPVHHKTGGYGPHKNTTQYRVLNFAIKRAPPASTRLFSFSAAFSMDLISFHFPNHSNHFPSVWFIASFYRCLLTE